MITITRFIKDPKGARIGYIDCTSAKYKYHKLSLFEKNNYRWIAPPAAKTEKLNDKGYAIYEPYQELLDKKDQEAFSKAVIIALDIWLQKNKPEIAEPRESQSQNIQGENNVANYDNKPGECPF